MTETTTTNSQNMNAATNETNTNKEETTMTTIDWNNVSTENMISVIKEKQGVDATNWPAIAIESTFKALRDAAAAEEKVAKNKTTSKGASRSKKVKDPVMKESHLLQSFINKSAGLMADRTIQRILDPNKAEEKRYGVERSETLRTLSTLYIMGALEPDYAEVLTGLIKTGVVIGEEHVEEVIESSTAAPAEEQEQEQEVDFSNKEEVQKALTARGIKYTKKESLKSLNKKLVAAA